MRAYLTELGRDRPYGYAVNGASVSSLWFLRAWYRADALFRSEGSEVTFWQDGAIFNSLSGVAPGPLFRGYSLNGRPAVQWDGTARKLSKSGATLNLTDQCTIFMVLYLGQGSSDEFSLHLSAGAGAATGIYLQNTASNEVRATVQAGGAKVVTSTSTINVGAMLVTLRYHSTEGLKLYINGVQEGGTIATGAVLDHVIDRINLGCEADDTNRFSGRISEVVVTGQAVSDTIRTGIENELGCRWAITVPGAVCVQLGARNEITQKVSRDQQQRIEMELERNAFQRTVDDVQVQLANISGIFSTMFSLTAASTRWLLEIESESSRRIFRGFLDNPSVVFDTINKTVRLQAFSANRLFWDRAKTLPVYRPTLAGGGGVPFQWLGSTYITWNDYFTFAVTHSNLWDDGRLFTWFDLGEYGTRQLRAYADNATVGNQGRLNEMDPNLTWYELLEAMSRYYNAEFFVDPETAYLTMRRRGAVLNEVNTDLGPLVLSSKSEVQWLDDGKVDYLYTFSTAAHPGPVFLYAAPVYHEPPLRQYNEISANSTQEYILTSTFEGVEQFSNPVAITVELGDPGAGYSGWWVHLRIPPTFNGVQRRTLYRKDGSILNSTLFYLVAWWDNNLEVIDFTDSWGPGLIIHQGSQPGPLVGYANQWIRWDEATNVWEVPILDTVAVASRPSGNILDVVPNLRFHVIGDPTTLKDYDPFDVFSFFARDAAPDSESFRAQWIDVFRTRRVARIAVIGEDYKLGDQHWLLGGPGPMPNDLTLPLHVVIRKAGINLNDMETDLELVTK